jgi:hypothetical protein
MAQPNYTDIQKLLSEYKEEDVKIYIAYLDELWNKKEKDKDSWDWKTPNQAWMSNRKTEQYANYFMKVSQEWLVFDGKHITLQTTGISYDYVALKNKMLLIYPDSKIDMSLVYKGDTFSFSKENGKIHYTHDISNPFWQKETDIIWGYVVIKNGRGEFLTRMSLADLEKHKATAKTQAIWKAWLTEMYRKTLMKKACSEHFKDIFTGIEEQDNEEYEPTVTSMEQRNDIDIVAEIKTLEELKEFYLKNKGKGKDFDAIVNKRKIELIEEGKKKDLENPPVE